MWLFLVVALLGAPGPTGPEREALVADACAAWTGARAAKGPATHRVGPDGLCFSGDITAENSAEFVQVLAGLDPTIPLVVVVTSDGGEINAGMSMGEALVPFTTTVVAQRVCASSCANYLFTAGDRRVIGDNALLLFHGGAHPLDEAELRTAIAPQVRADQLEAQVAAIVADVEGQIRRQDAFSERAGIDIDFFRWMAGFNDLSEEDFLELCAVRDPVMIAYSDRRLATQDVVVHENRGPQSQQDVTAAVAGLGRTEAVCFMA